MGSPWNPQGPLNQLLSFSPVATCAAGACVLWLAPQREQQVSDYDPEPSWAFVFAAG